MKAGFNSDFFITAATIIPVFYIALAVQGSGRRPSQLDRLKEAARYINANNALDETSVALGALWSWQPA
jgi:hypothetical protein